MQTTNDNKKVIPFGGILLVLAGIFALLQQFVTIELSGGLFFAVLGLFFILWGATQHKVGLLIPGGILTGLSIGVFLVEDASTIPEHFEGSVFLLSLAAGFALVTLLSRIFTSEKSWWALIVSGVLALVGGGILILEMPDTNTLKPLVEAVFNFSNYLWPLVLVAIGVWIIVKKREV
jgi:hypothetical protein